jgi:N-acetylglucosamine-6-phosphate deacetylase
MAGFVLDGATLWIGDGSTLDGHVVVQGDRIAAVQAGRYQGSLPVTDLRGLALSPGMIDLMVLSGFDKSLLRDGPDGIARDYLRLGVTHCQFCTGTLSWEAMRQVAASVEACRDNPRPDRAGVIGVYWEGPFQLPRLTGASLAQYALPANRQNVDRLLHDFGRVTTMVNVSPETEGDITAIAQLTAAGVVVSMAHSDAHADRVLQCIEAGTRVLGHCWNNNMGALAEPGVQKPTLEHVALTDDRIRAVHLICDGTHVHPVIVRLVHRCRGIEGICLVTDAVTKAGGADGPYTAEDGRAFYKRNGVGRTDTGHLCGSGLLLPDHLRNFIRFTGIAPHQAIRTVTLNPAASLKLDDRLGLLGAGRIADLVAWDPQVRVRRVWRAGVERPDVSDYAEIHLNS